MIRTVAVLAIVGGVALLSWFVAARLRRRAGARLAATFVVTWVVAAGVVYGLYHDALLPAGATASDARVGVMLMAWLCLIASSVATLVAVPVWFVAEQRWGWKARD